MNQFKLPGESMTIINTAQIIDELLNPRVGEEAEISRDDEVFIEEMQKLQRGGQIGKGSFPSIFNNVIRQEGQCGFASGGSKVYLLNTSATQRFRVTVRINWRQGIEKGEYDRLHISEAGGKILLGCTSSVYNPPTYYERMVVGEISIS